MRRRNLPGAGKAAGLVERQGRPAKPAGAKKVGAPMGNANALKHGKYTQARRALIAEIRAHIRQGRALAKAAADG
jgi:hypothetical protein